MIAWGLPGANTTFHVVPLHKNSQIKNRGKKSKANYRALSSEPFSTSMLVPSFPILCLVNRLFCQWGYTLNSRCVRWLMFWLLSFAVPGSKATCQLFSFTSRYAMKCVQYVLPLRFVHKMPNSLSFWVSQGVVLCLRTSTAQALALILILPRDIGMPRDIGTPRYMSLAQTWYRFRTRLTASHLFGSVSSWLGSALEPNLFLTRTIRKKLSPWFNT